MKKAFITGITSQPEEVNPLGDPSKSRMILGWEPKTDFEGLVNTMMDADPKLTESEQRAEW